MTIFNNGNFGANNLLGGSNALGANTTISSSMNNLLGTCDPRDQLAQDIRMFNQTGIGNVRGMLETRLGQIECRNQEAFDLRSTLSQLGPNTLGNKW